MPTNSQAGIEAHQLSIKQESVHLEDGSSFSFGPPFLDHKIRINGENVTWGVCDLIIQVQLTFDGISTRKLAVEDTRNMITWKWMGKVSLSPRGLWKDIKKIPLHIGSTTLKAFWLSAIPDIASCFANVTKQVLQLKSWTPDCSDIFEANMTCNWVEIGVLDSRSACFHNWVKEETDFPTVVNQTRLRFLKPFVWCLHHRFTVPLYLLNRDHAGDAGISAIASVVANEQDTILEKERVTLPLGKIKFQTLATSNDQ